MIVVFGSINVDLVARVEHIPRPGETVLSQDYAAVPGGKGANQALAAARAGSKVVMAGACGRDGFADLALSLLDEAGVDLSLVARVLQPTGLAMICVDRRGENAIVVASGANGAVSADPMKALHLKPGDILLLQREIPDEAGFEAARWAKRKGAAVILNAAPAGAVPEDVLRTLDILIVNEHEALDLARGLGLGLEDPKEAAAALHRQLEVTTIITLGAQGAIGWAGGLPHAVPALPVAVVDSTAAGDSFVGAFAAALGMGLDFPSSLKRGVAAGSLACTKAGAQPSIPTKIEIDAILDRQSDSSVRDAQ